MLQKINENILFQHAPNLQCFKVDEVFNVKPSQAIGKWISKHLNQKFNLKDSIAENLAQVLPLLICGEQSAICVFSNEINRLKLINSDKTLQLITSLQKVVNDEYYHDKLIQLISKQIPQSNRISEIKRRAQVFYAGLGSQHEISTHFEIIAQLDSSVCKVLNIMGKSKLGPNHPINLLFHAIKQDEAKHVNISKNHAKEIGDLSCGIDISESLLDLLATEADSFEVLGIDFDYLSKMLISTRKVI